MTRAAFFFASLFFSFQAAADDKEVVNHLKVDASIEAKALTKGAPDRSEVARFKDKKQTEVSVACKLLDNKKLDCVLIAYGESHEITVGATNAKDTLLLGYSEKGQQKMGIKEVHLVLPGIDGVSGNK